MDSNYGRPYKVNKGFMAFQFDEGKPVYSIGIERNALETHGTYRCKVGKENREITVTTSDVKDLIDRYGKDKVIRKIRGKDVYIIPLRDL